MMTLILWLAGGYVFLLLCWVLYLAIMNLKEHRREMGPVAKINGYLLLIIGYAMDLFLTGVIGTILFLDPPQEWTFTGRLKRYKGAGPGPGRWRYGVAVWICEKLLDQFDPSGKHC